MIKVCPFTLGAQTARHGGGCDPQFAPCTKTNGPPMMTSSVVFETAAFVLPVFGGSRDAFCSRSVVSQEAVKNAMAISADSAITSFFILVSPHSKLGCPE